MGHKNKSLFYYLLFYMSEKRATELKIQVLLLVNWSFIHISRKWTTYHNTVVKSGKWCICKKKKNEQESKEKYTWTRLIMTRIDLILWIHESRMEAINFLWSPLGPHFRFGRPFIRDKTTKAGYGKSWSRRPRNLTQRLLLTNWRISESRSSH